MWSLTMWARVLAHGSVVVGYLLMVVGLGLWSVALAAVVAGLVLFVGGAYAVIASDRGPNL